MTDTRPAVPPVEGHYALIRGQSNQPPTLCGPICLDDHNPCTGGWTPECSFDMSGKGYEPQDDLIGLLDRDLVKALIDGRVQALIDAAGAVAVPWQSPATPTLDNQVDALNALSGLCAAYQAITAIQGEKP